MPNTQNDILKIIHDTKAVSIWNRKTGPVFWYAAGVPGPFYVNTELVIGPELATELLEKITTTLTSTNDPAQRIAQLNITILSAYEASPQYRKVIGALASKVRESFANTAYTIISGGERRDWLFSIPLAKEMGLRHLFLFKNQTHYCDKGIGSDEIALHIADLINNAASYFDLWFPALGKANIRCVGTASINIRGTNGVNRLVENGQKVVTLNSIDIDFFNQWLENGLIDQATFDELATFFASNKEWGIKYLTTDVSLFEIDKLDKKSFERLQSFFRQDPWGLRAGRPDFFTAIKNAITNRSTVSA